MDCTASFSFDDPAHRRWLLAQEANVIVVDSLVRTHARDENVSGSTAALYREAFRPLIDAGRTLVLVHHTRKPTPGVATDSAHLIRGTSDLRALADSVLFLRRIDRRSMIVRHDKSRHGKPVESFVLGFEGDGNALNFRYVGETAAALGKADTASETILTELGTGTLTTGNLIARIKRVASEKTVRRAIAALEAEGVIAPTKRGRNTFWKITATSDKGLTDV